MTNTEELQQQVFQTIKSKIPAHLSAAEEIAGILDISADSAYRRLRGEKTISLDELYKLCIHYRISLDQMLKIQTGAILFNGLYVNEKSFRFDEYLKGELNTLAYLNSFKHTELYWLCKDIPPFHHYQVREIAAFKYFFWMKTILHMPEFRTVKLRFQDYPDDIFELGRRFLQLYQKPSVTEFWNIEGINSTIRQIEFYRDSDVFESDKDVYALYEALEKLLTHLEKQADLGYQFQIDDKEMKPLGSFQMYYNEVFLGDNSALIIMDGQKLVIISHSAINYMQTQDQAFCEHTNQHINNLMQKSTLISSANEKERARFFKSLSDKISNRKKALKV
jgi:transcriptional regulator with XRE-family HTH domain